MEITRTTDGALLMDMMAPMFGGPIELWRETERTMVAYFNASQRRGCDPKLISDLQIKVYQANQRYINAAIQTQVLERLQKIAA